MASNTQPPTRRIDRAAVLMRFYSAVSADGSPRVDPEARERESELQAELERLDPGHPDRALLLSLMGEAYKMRFAASGKANDLERALELNKRGVAQADAGDPFRPRLLAHVADARIKRFETSHDRDELVLAVGALREALALMPDGHRERVRVVSLLAVALATLGRQPGNADALQEAHDVLAALMDDLSSADPRRAGVLMLYAGVLEDRYLQNRSRSDLEHAIRATRQALTCAHAYDLRIPQGRAKLRVLEQALAAA
jgi:hypothetical protein